MLADVGLIHMNGRVYDPLIGRFGAPDPMTESPYSTQGWNRYAYVGNSPLNFTDPSGYCFAGCFWQKPFKALGKLLRRTPIIGQLLTVAAGFVCGPICSTLTSAAVAGLASGDLGQALKAGLISAATSFAMFQVGELTGGLGLSGVVDPVKLGHGPLEFLSEAHVFNMAAHAAVGCGSAVASGGDCGPGALSGAVGSLSSHLPIGEMSSAGKLAVVTVSGGLASVAGGGKFGNGAVTAAFGYLYNSFELALGALGGVGGGALCAGSGPATIACVIIGRSAGGYVGNSIDRALGIEDWYDGILWNENNNDGVVYEVPGQLRWSRLFGQNFRFDK
jgi:RHS repeat-associated protein